MATASQTPAQILQMSQAEVLALVSSGVLLDPAQMAAAQKVMVAPSAHGIGMAKGAPQVGLHADVLKGSGGHPGMPYVPGVAGPGPPDPFGNQIPGTESGQITDTGTRARSAGNLYQPGDEQRPGGGTNAQITQMQTLLVKAGLLKPQDVRSGGIWDAKSAAAYKIVLAYANVHGMNANDALDVFLSSPASLASLMPAPSPLTNSATVAAAVSGGGRGQTNTAQSLIGQNLSPSETMDFAKQYRDQEIAARQSYLDANFSGKATYDQAPDVQTAAETYIKQHELGKQVAYGTASRMLDFFNLLKGVV